MYVFVYVCVLCLCIYVYVRQHVNLAGYDLDAVTCRLPPCIPVETSGHTPSIAFRHLPTNSAIFSYATEGALYLRAAVHRRGQRPPEGLGINMTVEAT